MRNIAELVPCIQKGMPHVLGENAQGKTNKREYYDYLKTRAREVREKFELTGVKIGRRELRSVYAAYGIRIDKRRLSSRILGIYQNNEYGVSVAINETLPKETAVFTMAHELKHHLEDQEVIQVQCALVSDVLIEVGAGVFASELLFPEAEFESLMEERGVEKGKCDAEVIVRLKHDTKTTLSHTALSKIAIRLGYGPKDVFEKPGWQKISDAIYGIPYHRQPHIVRRRKARREALGF